MPPPYRAPEVILGMRWGTADFLELKSLFGINNSESEEANNAHHLTMMTALLRPPPPAFLNRSKQTAKYWNED
ncbi:kinase-like protein, partial [Diplocarpon rosae]